jgi:NAD dependent epimerase/dehydratase family enzyme
MGEMAVIVLEGSKVSSEKIKREGYQFQFPELIPALKNIYG